MKTRRRQMLEIFVAVWIGVVILVVVVLLYQVEGSGLGDYGNPTQATFERGKTLWNWMQLLIVPAILAGAAVWFNNQSSKRDQSTNGENN